MRLFVFLSVSLCLICTFFRLSMCVGVGLSAFICLSMCLFVYLPVSLVYPSPLLLEIYKYSPSLPPISFQILLFHENASLCIRTSTLYSQLPPAIRLAKPLEMDAPMSESEALGALKVLQHVKTPLLNF